MSGSLPGAGTVSAPPVAVWTLRQLITFLTGVEHDRLAALCWLIALCGLRRGEAADVGAENAVTASRCR